jgi:hypothetical protein
VASKREQFGAGDVVHFVGRSRSKGVRPAYEL